MRIPPRCAERSRLSDESRRRPHGFGGVDGQRWKFTGSGGRDTRGGGKLLGSLDDRQIGVIPLRKSAKDGVLGIRETHPSQQRGRVGHPILGLLKRNHDLPPAGCGANCSTWNNFDCFEQKQKSGLSRGFCCKLRGAFGFHLRILWCKYA